MLDWMIYTNQQFDLCFKPIERIVSVLTELTLGHPRYLHVSGNDNNFKKKEQPPCHIEQWYDMTCAEFIEYILHLSKFWTNIFN